MARLSLPSVKWPLSRCSDSHKGALHVSTHEFPCYMWAFAVRPASDHLRGLTITIATGSPL